MNLTAAHNNCNGYGATIVMPKTDAEQDFVAQMIPEGGEVWVIRVTLLVVLNELFDCFYCLIIHVLVRGLPVN